MIVPQKVKEKYGFLPVSVWNVGKSKTLKYLLIRDIIKTKKYSAFCQELYGVDAKAGRSQGNLSKGAKSSGKVKSLIGEEKSPKTLYKFSEFNPSVAERIIRYWSEEGDTVLTPFSSRAIIAMVAKTLNRNSITYEIVPAYYEAMVNQAKQFERQNPLLENNAWMKFYLGDARNMKEVKDESIDLILTSPPYSCKEVGSGEFYESCPGQLTDIKTYSEFLQAYRDAIKECRRVLKKGKYCIWVLSDVRGQHKLYPLHADTIKIFQEEGFVPHDIIINILRTPLQLTVGKRAEDKITQKIHEYILVFKKPEAD